MPMPMKDTPNSRTPGAVLSRAEFLPPWWLRNPHLQTIATLWPRRFPGLPESETRLVEVEADGYIAAGSTITNTVPEGALGVARAKQRNIEGWRKRRFGKKD